MDAQAASLINPRQFEREQAMTSPWDQSQGETPDHLSRAQVTSMVVNEVKQLIDRVLWSTFASQEQDGKKSADFDFFDEYGNDSTGPFHPSKEYIDVWDSEVYNPHDHDQQTSSSSMMDYNRQLAQSPTMGFEAQPSLAPIEHHDTNPIKPQEGVFSVKEWDAIHDTSKPVPVESRHERARDTLRKQDEGQQQFQYLEHQTQLPGSPRGVLFSNLIANPGPDAPHITTRLLSNRLGSRRDYIITSWI